MVGVVVLAFLLVAWVGWWAMAVDAAVRPVEHWRAVGRPRGAWVLLLLITGWFGALVYALTLRRRLVALATA